MDYGYTWALSAVIETCLICKPEVSVMHDRVVLGLISRHTTMRPPLHHNSVWPCGEGSGLMVVSSGPGYNQNTLHTHGSVVLQVVARDESGHDFPLGDVKTGQTDEHAVHGYILQRSVPANSQQILLLCIYNYQFYDDLNRLEDYASQQ